MEQVMTTVAAQKSPVHARAAAATVADVMQPQAPASRPPSGLSLAPALPCAETVERFEAALPACL